MDLVAKTNALYSNFGQRKPMGLSAANINQPHFFLLRTMWGEVDLLTIFNTKRCRYQCHFCQLPAKSSRNFISDEAILSQFEFVLHESKHALSILDRVTISNEGSVLDDSTFPHNALDVILECINELKRVSTVVVETRLEFASHEILSSIKKGLIRANLDILTGFETMDEHIRDNVLGKKEPLSVFLKGLDNIAMSEASLTAYVLFKPDPQMTDKDAFAEAEGSIEFLRIETDKRGIPLRVRINPMYVAEKSVWAKRMEDMVAYQPPRITDVMRLAEQTLSNGTPVYIGLSTEGLSTNGYMIREDYTPKLIKYIKTFNDGRITKFDWSAIESTTRIPI